MVKYSSYNLKKFQTFLLCFILIKKYRMAIKFKILKYFLFNQNVLEFFMKIIINLIFVLLN